MEPKKKQKLNLIHEEKELYLRYVSILQNSSIAMTIQLTI